MVRVVSASVVVVSLLASVFLTPEYVTREIFGKTNEEEGLIEEHQMEMHSTKETLPIDNLGEEDKETLHQLLDTYETIQQDNNKVMESITKNEASPSRPLREPTSAFLYSIRFGSVIVTLVFFGFLLKRFFQRKPVEQTQENIDLPENDLIEHEDFLSQEEQDTIPSEEEISTSEPQNQKEETDINQEEVESSETVETPKPNTKEDKEQLLETPDNTPKDPTLRGEVLLPLEEEEFHSETPDSMTGSVIDRMINEEEPKHDDLSQSFVEVKH